MKLLLGRESLLSAEKAERGIVTEAIKVRAVKDGNADDFEHDELRLPLNAGSWETHKERLTALMEEAYQAWEVARKGSN